MAETLEEDTERRSVARKSTYDPKTAASARRTVKGIRTKHHENSMDTRVVARTSFLDM